MSTLSQSLAFALQHHQVGRLSEAEQIYRQILDEDPNQPDALHLLGVVAHQRGHHEVAVELIGSAIRIKGNVAEYHSHLGGAYLELKQRTESIASFRRALQLKPDDPVVLSNLGCALREAGQLDEAAECCRRAVRLNGELTDAHVNLGNVLRDQGKLENAVACYNRALERNPNLAVAHNNLGTVLRDLGKFVEALACYKRALELNPQFADVYLNLGNLLKDQRHLDEAIVYYARAIELKPNSSEAYSNLGNVLVDLGKLDDAIVFCRQALELNPNDAGAHNNLGNALRNRGLVNQAIDCYRRVLELKPHDAAKHSNLLLALQYQAGITLAELFESHTQFDRQHAVPLSPTKSSPREVNGTSPILHPRLYKNGQDIELSGVRQEHDRLRLGFVSADLGRHPVGNFVIRLFEHLQAEPVDLVCYSDRITKDDLSNRFQGYSTKWLDVMGISDEQLAEQIRADQIDILFDLAGHTAHNRMLVFARKPAPIQISWIGYEGTTGLSAIDYLIADPRLIPAESETYYRETIVRMPDGYVCYEPNEFAPAVGPLPLLKNGHPTFGCFNNLSKITPRVIEVWAAILQRIPNSRLILKYRGLREAGVRQQYRDAFSSNGVNPDRIELLPESPYAEYLASYDQVDIGLDPFPFTGGATTCEALWMGVPVVTYQGETFAGRHSSSHLYNVGLSEMIATNLDQYIELAVALANDTRRLADLRANLRDRMAASPLCDGKRFAQNFLKLIEGLLPTKFIARASP